MLTYKQLGRYGRLGNQMFQVASTIGLAVKHGYSYGFPYWINYDHLERFGSKEDIDIQSYFVNPLPLVEDREYTEVFIHWGYWNHNSIPDNTSLTGHMQSEKYFDHCKDQIRHYFTMKEITSVQMPKDAICIHVRRGDYDDFYHPLQTREYYEMALSNMPDAPVFVFSDEPDKAKQLLGNGHTYIEGNHYMVDLQLMSRCTHFILSNSTLCWWGWWLAKHDKCVIPRHWFGEKAWSIKATDIYTPEMIVI